MGVCCCGSHSTAADRGAVAPVPPPYADWASRIAAEHRSACHDDVEDDNAPDTVDTTLRDIPRLSIEVYRSPEAAAAAGLMPFDPTVAPQRPAPSPSTPSPQESPTRYGAVDANGTPKGSAYVEDGRVNAKMIRDCEKCAALVGDDSASLKAALEAAATAYSRTGGATTDNAAVLKDAVCACSMVRPRRHPAASAAEEAASVAPPRRRLVSNAPVVDLWVACGQATVFHIAQRARFLLYWPWVSHLRDRRWRVGCFPTGDGSSLSVVHALTFENYIDPSERTATPLFQADVVVSIPLRSSGGASAAVESGEARRRLEIGMPPPSLRVVAFRVEPPSARRSSTWCDTTSVLFAERYERLLRDVRQNMELQVDFIKPAEAT